MPSATNNVLCIYTIELVVRTGQALRLELRSDLGSPPVTPRCSTDFTPQNVPPSAADILFTVRHVLSYLVPAGHNVQLTTVLNVGGAIATIVNQTEEIFTPPP